MCIKTFTVACLLAASTQAVSLNSARGGTSSISDLYKMFDAATNGDDIIETMTALISSLANSYDDKKSLIHKLEKQLIEEEQLSERKKINTIVNTVGKMQIQGVVKD